MPRVPGGEKNKKSGEKWTEEELLQVYFLYKKLGGEGLHERNPEIIKAAEILGRTVRSTEAQTLMFRNLDRGGDYSIGNMNKICRKIWLEQEGKYVPTEAEINYPEYGNMKNNQQVCYPAGLLEWAGHKRGGVKKPFDKFSGRPNGKVIKTNLTTKIENWVESLTYDSPRIILLIGGPGNGKTDAMEYLVSVIDSKFHTNYFETISDQIDKSGNFPPRSIELNLDYTLFGREKLIIVQDASTGDQGYTSGECLIKDIEKVLKNESLFIAGINRGILAEAVSKAKGEVYDVLNRIVRGITYSLEHQPLWPLDDKLPYNDIAVWPMDVESLVKPRENLELTPAYQILEEAVEENKWNCENCEIQNKCPFFSNKKKLQKRENKEGLLEILSDFELIANNRWSFREIFSMLSYIIVGNEQTFDNYDSPCDWAKEQIRNISSENAKLRVQSIWQLNEQLYHSKLFSKWPSFSSIYRANKNTNKEIRDILSLSPITKQYFSYFSSLRTQRVYQPKIAKFLDTDFFDLMDPSQLSNVNGNLDKLNQSIKTLESEFSYSVEGGLNYVKDKLNYLETLLFEQLHEIEQELDGSIRFEPSISSRRVDEILVIIRSVAIRYFKRIHFTSKGISKDELVLQKFRKLNPHEDHNNANLKIAANLFGDLIHDGGKLKVILNSSISQPELEPDLAVSLQVARVKIRSKYIIDNIMDVPRPSVIVFRVKFKEDLHVPLTYDLYKALYLLKKGVRLSSLPANVVALLDKIKSRLAGEVVRDKDILFDSHLMIGTSGQYYRIDEVDPEIEITRQTKF